MRKMLTTICFILCFGSLLVPDIGRAQTGDNEFGFYTNQGGRPPSVNIEFDPLVPFTFYLVLTNSVNHDFNGEGISRPVTHVGGWQAKILFPEPTGQAGGQFYPLAISMRAGATDIGIKPDYDVRFAGPGPVIGNAVTLMTVQGFVVDSAPYEFYLGVTDFPENPGAMSYSDALDPIDTWHGRSVPAYPSSGSFDAPVFSVNSPGSVVATENESWGAVKALYR